MKTYKNRKKKFIYQLNIHKMRHKKKLKLNHKKILAGKAFLRNKILLLPHEIQKRIYIFTWKLFWRNYYPLTSKITPYINNSFYIQKLLWESIYQNIHFLHLPFNIIPENKTWILGCQCSFCLNETITSQAEKHCHYLVQYRDPDYFYYKMPEESISYWNNHYILYGDTITKIYDPLCGSYKENLLLKKLREGSSIRFSDKYLYMTYPKKKNLSFGKQVDLNLYSKNKNLFIFGRN